MVVWREEWIAAGATPNDQSVSVVSIPSLASQEPPKNPLGPNEQCAFAAWQEI